MQPLRPEWRHWVNLNIYALRGAPVSGDHLVMLNRV